jgi:hypothetical protein
MFDMQHTNGGETNGWPQNFQFPQKPQLQQMTYHVLSDEQDGSFGLAW